MSTLVSIVTPCYNQGIYLDEAIKSIPFKEVDYEIEHIIINDGSTDEFTIQKLKELEDKGNYIIHQNNQGLSAARNNTIMVAKGKYIIPLDADNKLHLNYLTKAVDILEVNDFIDVIYGDKMLFGNKNGLSKAKKFKPNLLVKGNYIDACAIFRKSIWEKAGGYDCNMRAGHEDWEFWINIFIQGGKFYYLDDLCFYYRVRTGSMISLITKDLFEMNRQYIIKKHADYFAEFYRINYPQLEYINAHKVKAAAKLLLGKNFI